MSNSVSIQIEDSASPKESNLNFSQSSTPCATPSIAQIDVSDFSSFLNNYKENEKLKILLNEIIHSSIVVRDFLGLQLDYALGNIAEEFFNKEKESFYSMASKLSNEELKSMIALLLKNSNISLNPDNLSGLLNCDLYKIEEALLAIQKDIEDDDPSST